jgi:hypothetical protein
MLLSLTSDKKQSSMEMEATVTRDTTGYGSGGKILF